MLGQPRACRAGDIVKRNTVNGRPSWIRRTVTSRTRLHLVYAHFSEQADGHFISAERNAARVRSLQRSHDDIRISSQCLTVVMA